MNTQAEPTVYLPSGHRRKPTVPCHICGADTQVAGYTYGACSRCTKIALKRYAQSKRNN